MTQGKILNRNKPRLITLDLSLVFFIYIKLRNKSTTDGIALMVAKTSNTFSVSANLKPVQIYQFLSKMYHFLSKLSRNLSKFKHHFWEFWKFIPPQNSIACFREWMCKNFFCTFIISRVIPKKLNLYFQIWTETCKFGQESDFGLLVVYKSGQKQS